MRRDEACAWTAIASVLVLFVSALTGQLPLTFISAGLALVFGFLALRGA